MTDKWVLVTGANGGIGKALVHCFLENDYKVIAVDKLSENPFLEQPEVFHQQLDLERIALESEYTGAFVDTVLQVTNGQGITSLINNAAVQILGHCDQITRDDWQQSFNVNLSAPFFLIQAFLEQLTNNQGSVVNVSSIHATQTKQNFLTYASTKGALSSFTRNLAVDLRDKIRVNAIEPAAVATEMLKAGFEGHPEKYSKLEQFHPIARIATPAEVAELALFLCSEKAGFIHGACISSSGGIQGSLSDPD